MPAWQRRRALNTELLLSIFKFKEKYSLEPLLEE